MENKQAQKGTLWREKAPAREKVNSFGRVVLVCRRCCPLKTSAVKGREICPVRTFCRQGRILLMRTTALLGAKNSGIFEIYGVSARTRGRGSIFHDFVLTSFMDDPLL